MQQIAALVRCELMLPAGAWTIAERATAADSLATIAGLVRRARPELLKRLPATETAAVDAFMAGTVDSSGEASHSEASQWWPG